jgi:peroxiredoxin
MNGNTLLLPRRPVPELVVETVGGPIWHLDRQRPDRFTLIVFYRGLHCPRCGNYLKELDSKLGKFAARGVGAIAISSDVAERATAARQRWALQDLALGYGLDLDTARRWGLYISSTRGKTSAGIEESQLFNEPALFLVRPDGTLYFASVQTMPFARPHFDDVLSALDFVIANDYPARGEVADHARSSAA